MSKSYLNKWSKDLLKGINEEFAQMYKRQWIINTFLCEKLSDEDQSLLVGKLKAHDNQTHDNQTQKDKFEADMAKFEKIKEMFKENDK